jgi:hypothetical protein
VTAAVTQGSNLTALHCGAREVTIVDFWHAVGASFVPRTDLKFGACQRGKYKKDVGASDKLTTHANPVMVIGCLPQT